MLRPYLLTNFWDAVQVKQYDIGTQQQCGREDNDIDLWRTHSDPSDHPLQPYHFMRKSVERWGHRKMILDPNWVFSFNVHNGHIMPGGRLADRDAVEGNCDMFFVHMLNLYGCRPVKHEAEFEDTHGNATANGWRWVLERIAG